MKTLIFNSENDAYLVASQLYNCELKNNIIKYRETEEPAVTLAISLAGVDLPIVEGACCLLPFPRDERECNDEDTPKIYVACLAAYNCGHLHGMWINCTQDADEIKNDINWMLSWSPVANIESCDEWAIHDYEDWEGISLGENEDIDKLAELAQLIKEHGEAYAKYCEYVGTQYATVEDFEDRYRGEYKNEEDFAYELWEEQGTIEKLQEIGVNDFYIDWKAIARDYFISDFNSVEISYEKILVFHNY